MNTQCETFVADLAHCLAGSSSSDRALLAHSWACAPWPEHAAEQIQALVQQMNRPDTVARQLADLATTELRLLVAFCAAGGTLPHGLLEAACASMRFPPGCVSPRAYLANLAAPLSPLEQLFLRGFLHTLPNADQSKLILPTDLQVVLRNILAPPAPEPCSPAPVNRAAALPQLEHRMSGLLELAQAGQLEVQAGGTLNRISLQRLARRWTYDPDAAMVRSEERWRYVRFLRCTLHSAGLLRISADGCLRPTAAAGHWLAQAPEQRLRHLVQGWIASTWNELADFLAAVPLPSIEPAAGRRALLDLLATLPAEQWIAITDLAEQLRWREPELALELELQLAPYLDLAEWLRASLGTSLHWLAVIDLGQADDAQARPLAIRLSRPGDAVLTGATMAQPATVPLAVQANFEIVVPPNADLLARFQVSRIADLKAAGTSRDVELYQLKRQSILRAARQGIDAAAIERFLRTASDGDLPPNVLDAVHEWAGDYGRLRITRGAVLQADEPLLLEGLRHDRRLRLPEHTPLDDRRWLLHEGDIAALLESLQRLGYGIAGDIAPIKPALPAQDLARIATALRFYAAACERLGLVCETVDAGLHRVEELLDSRRRESAAASAAEAIAALAERLEGR